MNAKMGDKKNKPVYTESQCQHNLGAVDDALYVLGGKWKLKILIALSSGYTRFNELQRTLKGISARVLSNELKELELNGLLKRIVHTDRTPVVVEYTPTEYSQTIRNVVSTLADWGNKHKKKITSKP